MRKLKVKKEWDYKPYVKSSLRKIWRWSPNRRLCLKSKFCAYCKKAKKKLFADHIDPVVNPLKGFETWDIYIERLFQGVLQPLCKACHKGKSKEEAKVRAQTRKLLKIWNLAILNTRSL